MAHGTPRNALMATFVLSAFLQRVQCAPDSRVRCSRAHWDFDPSTT